MSKGIYGAAARESESKAGAQTTKGTAR